jgi:hypothetical protein
MSAELKMPRPKYLIKFCGMSAELMNEQELHDILEDSVIQAYPNKVTIEYLGWDKRWRE